MESPWLYLSMLKQTKIKAFVSLWKYGYTTEAVVDGVLKPKKQACVGQQVEGN